MLTAWDFVGSTGDTSALVNMDANIAGESAVSSKQWNRKYSFSLGEDPLDPTLSRVQNLAISVNDVVQATPASTVYHNTPPDGLVDFDYVTNAGMNGHTELLTNGDARTILNTDNFAGNDNGGSDGEALAWAIMDTVQLQLPVGDYTIKFTGTVKGNSGAADIPFSITQLLTIHGPGCQPIVVP
jgi:hypothetical protein